MKLWLKSILVVEGRDDHNTLQQFVDSLILESRGLSLANFHASLCPPCGLYILTDPDGPGDRIAKALQAQCPDAIRITLSPKACRGPKGKLGIAYASQKVLEKAFLEASVLSCVPPALPTSAELYQWGFAASANANQRRDAFCKKLGLPPLSSKQFAKALAHHPSVLESLRKGEHHALIR